MKIVKRVNKEMKGGQVKKSFVNRKRRNNKAIIFLYDVSVLKITLFNQNKKNYL